MVREGVNNEAWYTKVFFALNFSGAFMQMHLLPAPTCSPRRGGKVEGEPYQNIVCIHTNRQVDTHVALLGGKRERAHLLPKRPLVPQLSQIPHDFVRVVDVHRAHHLGLLDVRNV